MFSIATKKDFLEQNIRHWLNNTLEEIKEIFSYFNYRICLKLLSPYKLVYLVKFSAGYVIIQMEDFFNIKDSLVHKFSENII